MRAQQRLRERAQRTNESCTSRIEDILNLCNGANNAMTEEEKIKHILKNIHDEAFAMLLAKNPWTVAQVANVCQKLDELQKEGALTGKLAAEDWLLCSLISDEIAVSTGPG